MAHATLVLIRVVLYYMEEQHYHTYSYVLYVKYKQQSALYGVVRKYLWEYVSYYLKCLFLFL